MSDKGNLKKSSVSMKKGSAEDTPPRRLFLKGIAALGAVAAVPLVHACSSDAKSSQSSGVIVFRLQARRTKHCNACANHHKFKLFLTREFADKGRAHIGCNCPITTQEISNTDFQRLFGNTGAIESVDLRKI